MNCLNYLCVSSVKMMLSQRTGFSLKMKGLFWPLLKLPSRTHVLEQETVKQSLCELWKNSRKNRITSTNAHRVFIRKRNFESLAESLLNPNLESNLPAATRDAFRHGRICELVAREKYLLCYQKLQGGQRELEEYALQNLLEVVSLLKVLQNNFLVGTA